MLTDHLYFILTVWLLEARAGTASSILFGFTPSGVTDKKITVIIQQLLFELILAAFINIFSVVGDDRLSYCCTDGVNLCHCTSTLYTNTDIEIGKFLLTEDKDWFVCLKTERFGLKKFNWLTIDLNKSPTLLGESTSGGSLFPIEAKRLNV